jgi:glycosyltransferase involved in cell wall biosynthesis
MILYVGNTRPHKNLSTLLKAFALYCKNGAGACTLTIVGRDIFDTHPLKRLCRQLGIHDRVRFLGFVTQEDLPLIYHHASLFAFPSLYEGFGLPPLEAMACGTPVVASNIPALREVLGDAAVLVNPRDPEAWSSAIQMMMDDEKADRQKAEAGKARAAGFTWEKAGEATCRIYTQVLEKNS